MLASTKNAASVLIDNKGMTMPAQHYLTFSLRDFSDEVSSFTIYNGALLPTSLAGYITQIGQMRGFTEAITLGIVNKEMWVGDATVLSQARPVSEFAQRELKWRVKYRGTLNNKLYQLEIPTADPTGRLVAGTDLADLTNADMAAWIGGFELLARTPDNDNETVDVLEVRLVGRNI